MKYFYHTKVHRVLGDLQTPVSIYLKVRDIYPKSALLESSDFHGHENSLSFIALHPLAQFSVNRNQCTMDFPDRRQVIKDLTEAYRVEDALNEFIGCLQVEGEGSARCGLFGYTSFDAVRYFEPIPVRESHHPENDAPDICYIFYKYLIQFDHFRNELTLVELLEENEESQLPELENNIYNRNFASYNFLTSSLFCAII